MFSGLAVSGRGYIRGTACKKFPLYRLLFALFLPNQEKGYENISKVNDHLSYQVSLILLYFLSLGKSAFLSRTVDQKKLDSGSFICYNMEIMNGKGVDFP